jgi:porin
MHTQRRIRLFLISIIILGGMLVAATTAVAQETTAAATNSPHTSPERSTPSAISHDLEEALRTGQLHADAPVERLIGPLVDLGCGVHVEPIYWGEVFSNTRGGISTRNATQYQGLLNLALIADFEQLGLPFGGEFFIVGQNSHGQGLTEDFIGDSLVLSNIDTFDNRLQVGEYWWEFHFLDGDVRVRLGKQDVNAEFLVVDLAGDFIQSGFGISPNVAVPTFPDASAGVVVLTDLTDELQFKLGVWDGVPDGRSWGFSETGITLTAGELEYRYELGDGRLPGAIDGGMGYLSAGNVSPGVHQSQGWAVYIDFEQILWRENPCDEEDEQGFGGFVQYSKAYPDDLAAFPEYFGAGLVYQGLLPGRDDDGFGTGVATTRLNLGGTGRETIVECYYKVAVRPGMVVQPDLQYIVSPSGIHRDAFAVGLRFILAL